MAVMAESQTGQLPTKLDPHTAHRHRCLHGITTTLSSLSPHFLHFLFSSAAASSPPHLDSASSPPPPLTCARTCSRLFLSELAVASLLCAISLQIWFSTNNLFILSCRNQLCFLILWISSSFCFNLIMIACWIDETLILHCLFRLCSTSILTFWVCS